MNNARNIYVCNYFVCSHLNQTSTITQIRQLPMTIYKAWWCHHITHQLQIHRTELDRRTNQSLFNLLAIELKLYITNVSEYQCVLSLTGCMQACQKLGIILYFLGYNAISDPLANIVLHQKAEELGGVSLVRISSNKGPTKSVKHYRYVSLELNRWSPKLANLWES